MTPAVQPYRHDYLEPAFEHATAMDVMHHGVVACAPEVPVREAARAMTSHGTHALVVEGIVGNRLVWRVFTDMDLVRAARADQLDAAVGDIASAEAATVEPEAPLAEVAGLMIDHGVTHMVVVRGGRPTGVVSTADLTRAVAWSHS